MRPFLVLAASLLLAAADPTDAKKREMEALEGTWIVVNESSLRKGEKWIIAGGRIHEGEKDPFFRFYELRPRKTPKEIDLTIMAQEDGQPLAIMHGIYSLDGDQMRVYFATPGERRPNAFPQESGLTPVLVLTRQKPRSAARGKLGPAQCRLLIWGGHDRHCAALRTSRPREGFQIL